MDLQLYGYISNGGSVAHVCKELIKFLRPRFNLRFHEYTSIVPGVEYKDILGDFNPPSKVAIYHGIPGNIRFSGHLLTKHKVKIGSYVTETNLSRQDVLYLNECKHDYIIIPSQYCADIYKRSNTNDSRYMIVHHGISEIFKINNIEKFPNFTFLFVFMNSPSGGSFERKNIVNLLYAFSNLRNKHKDINLYIKTNTSSDITLNGNKNVTVDVSYMSNDQLCELYNKCHVYVNPTRAEGFGITPLEAMACGMPIVSPIHTGLKEYLDEYNCILVPSMPGSRRYCYASNDGPLMEVTASDLEIGMEKAYNNYTKLKIDSIYKSSYIRDRFRWTEVLKPLERIIRSFE